MTIANRMFTLATAVLVSARCWSAICTFPGSDWNAVRLVPSFMLRFGCNPYPGLEDSPVTTWIYGPVPLFVFLPATLAGDVFSALMTAGVINLLIAVLPVVWAVLAGGRQAGVTMALLVAVALWPNSSLHYLQADNVAIACGLAGNLLLLRSRGTRMDLLLAASVCSAMAVWSKQTMVGLLLAQALWMLAVHGLAPTLRYTIAVACAGTIGATAFISLFGFEGIVLNLVQLPGALPFWPEPLDRLIGLAPHLAGYVVLPALLVALGRKRVFRRDSPWLLPVLGWLCLLPTSILTILKVGGTANSLTGILLVLPVAAQAFVARVQTVTPKYSTALMFAVVAAITTLQAASAPVVPFRPLASHLDRATFLAREFPEQIYFPWNPLVTFYSDQRFYHAEDGIYVRHLGGAPLSQAQMRTGFPSRWCVTVFRGADTGWGLVERLHPPDTQRTEFAEWTLYSWPPPP